MNNANDILNRAEALAADRWAEIMAAGDDIEISGTTYYVKSDGDDAGSGLTPDDAWRTLARVSGAELRPGDGVRFRRGDIFRGAINNEV